VHQVGHYPEVQMKFLGYFHDPWASRWKTVYTTEYKLAFRVFTNTSFVLCTTSVAYRVARFIKRQVILHPWTNKNVLHETYASCLFNKEISTWDLLIGTPFAYLVCCRLARRHVGAGWLLVFVPLERNLIIMSWWRRWSVISLQIQAKPTIAKVGEDPF
jgi:hypothetical protein